MSSYKSEKRNIAHNISLVYSKLSNPEVFRQQLDRNFERMSDEARENLEKIRFEADGISIDSPMGPVKLQLSDCVEPERVNFVTLNAPVELGLAIALSDAGDDTTDVEAAIEVDLPFFLKSMVGSQLSEAAQKLADMLTMLPYADL